MQLLRAPARTLAAHPVTRRDAPARRAVVAAAAAEDASPASPSSVDWPRRAVLGAALAAAVGVSVGPARADGDEAAAFTVFYGTASPPTSYGGYGGNAKESAKYSFEYPSNWKVETIGKQEKGMVGIDARVRAPGRPGSAPQAYVITFGRAGEDNKAFKLGDVDRTLEGFAGADYNLQDALTAATSKKAVERSAAEKEEGVGAFYDYEVAGPDFTYLAAVTLKAGKVFALFVACPTKGFKGAEGDLRHIVETFKTL